MSDDYLYEAEKQIIGGLLRFGVSDTYCIYALDNLNESDFMIDVHKSIFAHIKNSYTHNENVDMVKLMKDTGVSSEYLADLINCCYTVANFKSYSKMLKTRTADNRIINGITSISKSDNKFDALEKLYTSEKELRENKADFYKKRDSQQYLEFLEYIHSPVNECDRIKTGFNTIDAYIGGFRRKSISIIGAYPSTGKTTFALNIARNQIKHKNKTLFFSLEMSCNQILERLTADILSLNYSRIGRKDLSKDEKTQIGRMIDGLSSANVLHIYDDVFYIEDISREISVLKPAFVVIDFIQRIKTHHKTNSRREEIDYISSEIKNTAMAYDCHIMTLSQLARKDEGHRPTMNDLKESGGLAQDNDYIMLLYRPNVGDKTKAPSETYFTIDKNKYGETGSKEMFFNGGFQRFTEVKKV